MRAGLARVTDRPYAPLPTAYDALFPNGTLLTAPRKQKDLRRLSADEAASIRTHMNEDHADAVLGYARTFAAVTEADSARIRAIDASGMDIDVVNATETRVVRVDFDHELRDSTDARETLIAMAKRST